MRKNIQEQWNTAAAAYVGTICVHVGTISSSEIVKFRKIGPVTHLELYVAFECVHVTYSPVQATQKIGLFEHFPSVSKCKVIRRLLS